jgi:chromosomal replication initiation ATPase DnaA
MTSALHTQAAHYAAIRNRLWPPRRQYIAALIKRPWWTPVVTQVLETERQRIATVVEEVMRRDRVTAREIAEIAAQAFDVDVGDMRGRSHRPRFRIPRMVAMAVTRHRLIGRNTGTFHAIARVYGRDHSTVVHAFQKYQPVIEAVLQRQEPAQ